MGSLARQIAKKLGAGLVVKAARNREKVKWLLETVGFDAAFNDEENNITGQLRQAVPNEIDVYFNNVGTEH